MTAGTRTDGAVTRADIEAKLAELRGTVDEGTERAKGVGLAVGVASAAVLIGVAFWLGRRKGRKRQAIIEIQRV